ncbi:tetratricopeptide repeat protein [Woeseiaceae bacterium]|nr:tetratricopeptide repeat protein [Woeseiaceae bacterium]
MKKNITKSIIYVRLNVIFFISLLCFDLFAQEVNQTTQAHLREAEVALENYNYKKVAAAYEDAANSSGDINITKQAAWLADSYHFNVQALSLAERWVEIDASSDSALLFLINRQIDTNLIIAAKENLKKLLARNEGQADEVFLAVFPFLTTKDQEKLNKLINYFVKIYHKSSYVKYAYATSLMQSGDYDKALSYANSAVALDSSWEKPKLLVARILLLSGKNSEAIDYVARYIGDQINPSSESRLELALLYMSSERLEDALGQVSQILLERNDQSAAIRLMAIINFRLDDYDAAWIDFNELFENKSYPMDALYYMARISEIKGNTIKAIQLYSQVNSGMNTIYSQRRVSNLMVALDKRDAARVHLKRFGQKHPKFTQEMLIAEADLLQGLGKNTEALTLYGDLIDSYPNEYKFSLRYAEILLSEGRNSEALKEYAVLVKRFPGNATILNAYGYLLTDYSKDYKKAIKLIKKALKIEPDNPAIMDSYGWALFRLGRYDQALKELKDAYSIYKDPEIAAHIVEVLLEKKQTEEARNFYLKAREGFPDSSYLIKLNNKFFDSGES